MCDIHMFQAVSLISSHTSIHKSMQTITVACYHIGEKVNADNNTVV